MSPSFRSYLFFSSILTTVRVLSEFATPGCNIVGFVDALGCIVCPGFKTFATTPLAVALAEVAIVPPPKVCAADCAVAALAVWAARGRPVLAIFVNLLAFLARALPAFVDWVAACPAFPKVPETVPIIKSPPRLLE